MMTLDRLFLAAALLAGPGLQASPGTAGAAFLKVPMAVAPAGMAGAQVALGSGLNALETNAAGLCDEPGLSFAASHLSYLEGLQMERGALGWGNPVLSGALSYRLLSSPDIPALDSTGASTGTLQLKDSAVGLALARAFGPLRLGVQGNLLSSSLAGLQSQGYSGGAGLAVRLAKGLWLGASIDDLGSVSAFESLGDSAPSTWRTGLGWLGHLTKDLTLAAEADVAQSADTALQSRDGIEFGYQKLVYARLGWVWSPSYDGQQGLTAGASFHLGGVSLDYAFAPFADLGVTHRFGLSANFSRLGEAVQGVDHQAKLAAPKALRLSGPADALRLDWDAPHSSKALQYWIYLRRGPGQPLERFGGKPRLSIGVRFKSVKPEWGYSVAVAAVDADGNEGERSEEVKLLTNEEPAVTATLPSVAAVKPHLTKAWVEGGRLHLSWEAPGAPVGAQYRAYLTAESGKDYRSLGKPREGLAADFPKPLGADRAYVVVTARLGESGQETEPSNELEVDLRQP